MNNKVLTKKQACEYLNISEYQMNAEIKAGRMSFLRLGKRVCFTPEGLEQWRNNRTYHTDYTNEAKSITPTSRSYPRTESEYSLEKLLEERRKEKQQNIVLNALRKSKPKRIRMQAANCLA